MIFTLPHAVLSHAVYDVHCVSHCLCLMLCILFTVPHAALDVYYAERDVRCIVSYRVVFNVTLYVPLAAPLVVSQAVCCVHTVSGVSRCVMLTAPLVVLHSVYGVHCSSCCASHCV